MTEVWDSGTFSARERAEALRETIRQYVVDVDLDLPAEPDDVQATVALSTVGGVQFCSVNAMPTVVRRSPRKAFAESEPSLFVTLQVENVSMMVQHGREAVLHPGQMAVYATTSPYSLMFNEGVHAHFVRFPLADLALPEDLLATVSARPIGTGDAVGEMAFRFLRDLAVTPMSTRSARLLAGPARELLRSALSSTVPESDEHRSAMAQSLAWRVEQYVMAHLGDPGLSAEQIAVAHHVSVRHLYATLSRAGVQLAELIRAERMERCRADLANPRMAALPVSAIARARGFLNASHFSRQFRERYGMTPTEWRNLRREAPVEPAHPAQDPARE